MNITWLTRFGHIDRSGMIAGMAGGGSLGINAVPCRKLHLGITVEALPLDPLETDCLQTGRTLLGQVADGIVRHGVAGLRNAGRTQLRYITATANYAREIWPFLATPVPRADVHFSSFAFS